VGGRLEHSSVTQETKLSPRASFTWTFDGKWTLRAATGEYYQFPDFEQIFGRLGNPYLKSEHAIHYNASIERALGDRTRLLAEFYDREDRDLFFSLNEPRIQDGAVTFGALPFHNSLRGHGRGFELTIQRRSANKLAGWISYAYCRTKLVDDRDK